VNSTPWRPADDPVVDLSLGHLLYSAVPSTEARSMKATANHPDYRPSKITCACGMVFDTFSTRGDFAVDVCSNCHPFYTGKQKLLDSAGRVERFNKKYGRTTGGQGQG
jgi:large subunit ribosomal protein L31